MSSRMTDSVWNVTSSRLGSRATRAPERLEFCAWDFGAAVRRVPAIVCEPANEDEVSFVLRVAGDSAIPIAVRGTGHSRSGQCLAEGSIVLDMRSISAVRVD